MSRRMTGRKPPQFTKLSEAQRLEAMRLYPLGWSCGMLAERYATTNSAMQHMLRRRGVEMRPAIVRNRRLGLNHSAFCTVTDESAYWAGFLMADGCIVAGAYANSSPQVVVALSTADIDHLNRWRSFLRYEGKITIQKPLPRFDKWENIGQNALPMARLAVSSKLIAADLERFGVVPRKTFTAEVRELESNKHFWRGMVDGDGCIVTADRPHLRLCSASKPLIEQFLAYCRSLDPKVSQHIIQVDKLWIGQVAGRTCGPILRELYGNLSVALPRKKRNAALLLERFSQPQRNRWSFRSQTNAA
jgi:hypothetical protein